MFVENSIVYPNAAKEQPVWIVKKVVPREDYTLLLTFADGSKRVYNAEPLLGKPVFATLKHLPFFLMAHVCGDTVIWDDEVDIAPEHLYECSIPIFES